MTKEIIHQSLKNPEPLKKSEGVSRSPVMRKAARGKVAARHGEEGYMLVALLGLMTILALMMIAAAPNVQKQAQREREKEAIFRGEEVVQAIRLYVRANNGQLPTTMDQLLEGIPRGTQRVQILRPAAARDPLTGEEWRLIRPGTQALLDFQRRVTLYADGNLPPTTEPSLARFAAPVIAINNLGSSAPSDDDSSDDDSGTGPFIGVASRSRNESVIRYYGIDHHNQWVFTPLFR
jgi:type II secretory pathway pseudopilin PulG